MINLENDDPQKNQLSVRTVLMESHDPPIQLNTQLTQILLSASCLVDKKKLVKIYHYSVKFFHFIILQIQHFIYFPINHMRYTYDSW